MALVEIQANNQSYEALSTDIVNNSIPDLQNPYAVGKHVYITNTGKTYTVLSDYTLTPYIASQVSIVESSSGNEVVVGSDGSFKSKIVSQDNVADISNDGSINVSTTDIISGTATSGTKSTITDTTKNFITNMLTGTIAEIDIGSTKYFRKVLSNTSDTITIDQIAGNPASAILGSGENGTVTITSITDGIGGNEYTVQALLGSGNNIPLSAQLTGLNLVVTLGTGGAGAIDTAKNTATLIAAAIDALEQFTAVASGTGADSINPTLVIDFTGGVSVITVGSTTPYKIKSTKTINNPVPTKNYLSQTQIGSDIDFSFLNSAVVNNQATPIDITKPVSPSQEHEIIVYNPSTVTDLTIKVFSISLSLSGQTRYAYITSLTVPKSATITGTGIDTYSFFLHGLLNGSNIRFQISNNTVLGVADGFTGTIRIREV